MPVAFEASATYRLFSMTPQLLKCTYAPETTVDEHRAGYAMSAVIETEKHAFCRQNAEVSANEQTLFQLRTNIVISEPANL